MKLDTKIAEKTKQLEDLGKEVNQLQQSLQEKQLAALRLDGAITQLKELQAENVKRKKD